MPCLRHLQKSCLGSQVASSEQPDLKVQVIRVVVFGSPEVGLILSRKGQEAADSCMESHCCRLPGLPCKRGGSVFDSLG